MKKVIYIPRKKGGETNINVNLGPSGGYMDFPVAIMNGTRINIQYPFNTGIAGAGGGRFNAVAVETSGNTVTMNYALEVFPNMTAFNKVLTAWNAEADSVRSVWETAFTSDTYYPHSFINTTFPEFRPRLDVVGKQNVIFSCYNAYTDSTLLNQENIAIIVNTNHYVTASRFFASGGLGKWERNSGEYTYNYEEWATAFNLVDNELLNLSGGRYGLNQFTTGVIGEAPLVVTFGKCLSQQQNFNASGIRYNYRNAGDTINGVGYANKFNSIITV